jgi:hypothetical protein
MMADYRLLTSAGASKTMAEVIFMAIVGLFLGTLGGLVDRSLGGLLSAAVLVGIFGMYNRVLRRNNGIVSGVVAGIVLGALVGTAGLLIGGTIAGPLQGALFGLVRGAIIGAVFGVVTRAQPHETDKWHVKLFLAVGSVALGALLGASVGLIAGFVLGAIGHGLRGAVGAAVTGAIVGGYLGSYYGERRWVLSGLIGGALLAAVSSLIGGALAGVVLGAITGALAPMLLVALIGAFGGLTSRGVIAMFVEAAEAPTEMLMQGAVPFLVPAMMVGLIVGAAAAGPGGLIAMPTSLAIFGLTFGVLGELEGKPNNQVTVRSIVEMAMMGADEWPVSKVLKQVTGRQRKAAVIGGATGILAGLLGSAAGVLIGQFLARLATS